jgi:transcriptional regulator with XRE-family HTH domain
MATLPTCINSIRDLAAAVRGRRQDLGLSQAELAARARVSRQWISEFEAGKPTAEVRLVIQLLEALELRLTLHEQDSRGPEQPGPQVGAVDLDELLEEYDRG